MNNKVNKHLQCPNCGNDKMHKIYVARSNSDSLLLVSCLECGMNFSAKIPYEFKRDEVYVPWIPAKGISNDGITPIADGEWRTKL
jgi:transcription elongation factor Elf1